MLSNISLNENEGLMYNPSHSLLDYKEINEDFLKNYILFHCGYLTGVVDSSNLLLR